LAGVTIEGIEDPALRSFLAARVNVDVEHVGEDGARREAERLTDILRDAGYRDATVSVASVDGDDVVMTTMPGALYRIGWISVEGLPADASPALSDSLGYLVSGVAGEPATASVLDRLRSEVIYRFREASFGRADAASPTITLEPETRTVAVTLTVTPGEPVTFGHLTFAGSVRHDTDALAAMVPFAPGTRFSPVALSAIETALVDSGQFSSVRVRLADAPGADGGTDVDIRVRDAIPDVASLDSAGRTGSGVLLAAILALFSIQLTRPTRLWSVTPIRVTQWVAAIALTAAATAYAVQRVMSFLT
jgi:hypothetical protein